LAALAAAALLALPACTRQVAGLAQAAAPGSTTGEPTTEPTAAPTGTTATAPSGPGSLPPSATTAPPSGAPGPRCPAEGSHGVPGGPQATYIAGYQTAGFRIYFCRGTDQRVYYRGVSRADPTSAVTLPAAAVPGGFEARTVGEDGRSYVYRVAGGRLVVRRDGAVLRDEPVLGQP
jgi:hypothetical protein